MQIIQHANGILGRLSYEAYDEARKVDPNAVYVNPIQIPVDEAAKDKVTLLANIGDALMLYVSPHEFM